MRARECVCVRARARVCVHACARASLLLLHQLIERLEFAHALRLLLGLTLPHARLCARARFCCIVRAFVCVCLCVQVRVGGCVRAHLRVMRPLLCRRQLLVACLRATRRRTSNECCANECALTHATCDNATMQHAACSIQHRRPKWSKSGPKSGPRAVHPCCMLRRTARPCRDRC